MNQSSVPDKHRAAIIQSSGSRRVRRPGSGRQLRIILFVFIVIALAVAVAYSLLRPRDEGYTLRDYQTAVAEVRSIQDDLQLGGTVRVRTEATLRASVPGILESLAVDVGEWVVPGQTVAVLDAEGLQDTHETLLKNLVQASRAHESMLLAREQALLVSARARENLEEALAEAEEGLAEARELRGIGTITAAALRGAEGLLEGAKEALKEHDEDADIAGRFHDLDRLGSNDTLQTLQAGIADVETQLAETRMSSPIEGRVVWTADTHTMVGEEIAQNTPILQIADTTDPFVETAIEEQYVSDISLGQQVVVTISGQDFIGVIERIGLLAVTPAAGGAPAVELDLSVEVEGIEVIPGGTALVELVVGVVEDAIVLPRGSYLSTGNHLYLYRIEGNTAVRLQATFGAVTEQYVQIISGVSAGDEIITSSYQNYIGFHSIDLGGNHD